LHTPGLPDIDESVAVNLDESMVPTTVEINVQKNDNELDLFGGSILSSLIHLPSQTMEEVAGLSTAQALTWMLT
jgi:hypothetical protein